MNLGAVAAAVGKGLAAGAVGTAAMTVSSTLEARLRGRDASTAPAEAVGRLLRVKPEDETGEKRLNNASHWGYGTVLGALRGLVDVAGLAGRRGTLAHLGLVWGAEQVVLPGLDVSTPAWKWPAKEVAIDAWHHVVYVVAVGLAYERLR